jgi:polyphosphate kinase 2 (PPK2 family)
VGNDLIDGYDEELELEIEDRNVDAVGGESDDEAYRAARRSYFKELFRLQGELVKLQDWVVHNRPQGGVLFEGRDAAGKGGVIKRITQRLNPRVCRVAALPAPNDRERSQWYFQRYVSHLPAGRRDRAVRPQLVQPRRRGAGHGLLRRRRVRGVLPFVPEFERMLVRSGIILIKYWFSITDDEQNLRFLDAHPRSAEAVEAQPDGHGVAPPLGAIHQGQGSHAGTHAHPRGAVVDREAVDKKKARLNCIAHLLSDSLPGAGADALRGSRARSGPMRAMTPALLISVALAKVSGACCPSQRPSCAAAAGASARSVGHCNRVAPRAAASSARAWLTCRDRPITVWPAASSWRAMARPMPREAPVRRVRDGFMA